MGSFTLSIHPNGSPKSPQNSTTDPATSRSFSGTWQYRTTHWAPACRARSASAARSSHPEVDNPIETPVQRLVRHPQQATLQNFPCALQLRLPESGSIH